MTKHEGTGGLIDRRTVTSQLLYEMGDPARYITPDCVAEFSSIQMEEEGRDRVSTGLALDALKETLAMEQAERSGGDPEGHVEQAVVGHEVFHQRS